MKSANKISVLPFTLKYKVQIMTNWVSFNLTRRMFIDIRVKTSRCKESKESPKWLYIKGVFREAPTHVPSSQLRLLQAQQHSKVTSLCSKTPGQEGRSEWGSTRSHVKGGRQTVTVGVPAYKQVRQPQHSQLRPQNTSINMFKPI